VVIRSADGSVGAAGVVAGHIGDCGAGEGEDAWWTCVFLPEEGGKGRQVVHLS